MTCAHCGEEILSGDPLANAGLAGQQMHHECFFRLGVGSVAHIEKRCSCYGGPADDGDPIGLTKREAAKLALETFRKREAEKN